jgi:hypothetical protein
MLMKTEAYDNIMIELQEVGWGSMDCIDMDQERDSGQALVNVEINLRVPQNAGNFLTS